MHVLGRVRHATLRLDRSLLPCYDRAAVMVYGNDMGEVVARIQNVTISPFREVWWNAQ